ncbi:MAG: hypothetical protein HYW24_05010 [Candidatus Aenigmarchaeota archaeon]|nr:hypothetical protein [Candidatus Aenigmarchaeota archaeon]
MIKPPYESRRPKSDFDIHKTGTKVFQIEKIFPYSFVPVQRYRSSATYGTIIHPDGAGTKPVQNYLHWRETDDINVFEWIADDVVAMNLDDVFCVTSDTYPEFVDYVAINRFKLPKEEFLRVLNNGFRRVFSTLQRYGINVSFLGGETAEVSDLVRTVDVSGTIRSRVKLKDAITGDKIIPSDVIIGLGSYGKSEWEYKENSGIMSNGITVVRHSLMTPEYVKQYPEIADSDSMEYKGRFRTDQYLDELGMTVGEAIISPTRIFAPVLKFLIEKYRRDVHGIVHNTGGGLTKGLVIGKDIHYVKDNLPVPPPIFQFVQRESGRSWLNIYEGLNNGVGAEVIVPEGIAQDVMEDVDRFGIPVFRIGYCEPNADKEKLSKRKNGTRMTIISENGKFEYPYEEIGTL